MTIRPGGVAVFDWEAFVSRCRAAAAESDASDAVREVMAAALACPDALLAGINPVPGGQTLWRSPELTLQRIIFPGGALTAPHEHRMWAVAGVCSGQEANRFWRRHDEGIERIGGRETSAGELVVMSSDVIHDLANPGTKPMISIHAYGGDIVDTPRSQWDLNGSHERPYDWAAGERFGTSMAEQGRQLGRPLTFDEVRSACISFIGAP